MIALWALMSLRPSSKLSTKQNRLHTHKKKYTKIKVLNINCRSIKNKVSEFQALLTTENPDIIIGTKSWLTQDLSSSEFLHTDLGYSAFREDHTSKTGRGEFMLVKNHIIASEQRQFKTDCDVVWVKIEMVGAKPLYIAAYYRPDEGDAASAEEFEKSLSLVNQEKGNIWVLGDLNYPKLTWDDDDVPIIKPGRSFPKLYEDFVDLMNENSLSQMEKEPTRGENILDLFWITNPTLVNSVTIIPELSDHEIVSCVVDTKPKQSKKRLEKSIFTGKLTGSPSGSI